MKLYESIASYILNNNDIPEFVKYDLYKNVKQVYIDRAKTDYKYLCYTINGSAHKTCKCAITLEYARELLNYSVEDMNTMLEVMLEEHITELQGGMIVL